MRSRKWILFLAIGIVAFAVTLYMTWRGIRANDLIKQALLERVKPFLSQESDIEHVYFDLNSLHLQGVKLLAKDGSFALEIEDVRLGYRFWNLLRYRLTPHKLAYDVILVHPVLVIPKQASMVSTTPSVEGLDPKEIIEELESIKRLTVVDAEVFLEDSVSGRMRLAYAMNGWVQASPIDSAIVRLEGKILSTQRENLKVDGKINLFTGRPVRLDVEFSESEDVSPFPYFLPPYVEVSSGKIRGDIQFSAGQPTQGKIEINEGAFSLKNANLDFENVNLTGTIDGKNLIIQGGVDQFNGSELEISGQILDVRDPRLDITLQCDRLNIPTFFQRLDPNAKLAVSGDASFKFLFGGQLTNPSMDGVLTSSNVEAYGLEFDRFRAAVGLQDTVLSLNGQARQNAHLLVGLDGRMDFTDSLHISSFGVDINGSLMPSLPEWAHKYVDSCFVFANARLDGPLLNLSGHIDGQINVDYDEGRRLAVKPTLTYENHDLNINILSNDVFTLSGTIASPFYAGTQWDLESKGLQCLTKPFIGDVFDEDDGDPSVQGRFSANEEGWEARIEGVRTRERSYRAFFADIISVDDAPGLVECRASLFGPEGEELPLFLLGSIRDDTILLRRFDLGGLVSAEGRYSIKADQPVQGRIRLTDFVWDKLHPVFPATLPFSGELEGGVRIDGTSSNPRIRVDVNLDKGQFHDVGLFAGEIEYTWENRRIRSLEASIFRDGQPVLQGRTEQAAGDSLRGHFNGKDVDIGGLITAVTGQDFFQGEGAITIDVSGHKDTPLISTMVEVGPGQLGPVPFQSMRAEAVDSLYHPDNPLGGSLTVQNGYLERVDGLKLFFWGNFPHSPGVDADVSVLAQGNLLGVLPELSSTIVNAHGTGEMFFRWAIQSGEWELSSGRLQIDEGEMELGTFVKRIENIKANAELRSVERFFEILDLSGDIEGERFSISNYSLEESGRGLQPIVLQNLGIQLGALQLVTTRKGIRAHLPGLMEKGEIGWLALEGKSENDRFTIAGPVDAPLLRGSLRLTDHRITYPFLKVKKESGKSGSLDFLKKINWDLQVIPRKDAHYIRNIESPLGNVYVDLLLHNDRDGLNLSGIIQENEFQVWGKLTATEGSLEVLDHFFKPERITFDYPKGASDPILRGRAYTTVTDTIGMPSTIWLSITQVDDVTGEEREGGPWSKVQFRFSTDNPNLGRTEADLLASLGYSTEKIADRAYDALGMQVENALFRPIFRPLERGIRRYLGLDVVRFSSMISRNLFQMQTMSNPTFDPKLLLRRSKLTLGKYLAPGLFIIYSGQVQQGIGIQYDPYHIGFRHALSLEYTIRPDLLLQMEYTYDSHLLSDRREDKRIWLRHVFPF